MERNKFGGKLPDEEKAKRVGFLQRVLKGVPEEKIPDIVEEKTVDNSNSRNMIYERTSRDLRSSVFRGLEEQQKALDETAEKRTRELFDGLTPIEQELENNRRNKSNLRRILGIGQSVPKEAEDENNVPPFLKNRVSPNRQSSIDHTQPVINRRSGRRR